jgi:signal transduction histidine kinase
MSGLGFTGRLAAMTVRTAHRGRAGSSPRWLGGFRSESAREDLLLGAVVGFAGLLEIVAGAVEHHRLVASVAVIGMAAALMFRRRHPLVVLVAVLLLFLIQSAAGVSANAQLATLACALIAAYSVGAHADVAAAASGLLLGLLVVVGVIYADGGGPSDYGFGVLVVAGPWLAGLLVRRRAVAAADSDAKAAAVAAAAQARALKAADDERARIARELHDVVSHGLSAMVVQATAAAELVDRDPDRARAAMREVQLTGREAMVEMKYLLGALRPPEGQARHPQPTLDEVAELVRAEQASGRTVSLEIAGDRRELPRGLALSAYRIVQEGLTNVRKHAGDASARVCVRFEPAAVQVEVIDDAAASGSGVRDPGYGLAGMRERAQLYGGRVQAGPRADGPGWHVMATFPLEPK